jgi:hypothetical protein
VLPASGNVNLLPNLCQFLIGSAANTAERERVWIVDLYALAPEEFTAARDNAAKQDKSLRALRKPSVSAWVVNTLVRHQADLLEQVLALGAELAQAQSQGKGAELRQLTEQRRQLVEAVTQQAVDLVDRDVTSAVRGEVAATLEAALADPASAEAVRTGQLVRALSYAGFGGVDLEGAVADLPKPTTKRTTKPTTKPTAKQVPAAAKEDSKKLQKLEAKALDAQGALDDAVQRAERTARELEASDAEATQRQQELDAAEERVQEARRTLAAAEKDHDEARSRRTKAAKAADELARKAERATRAVSDAQEASDSARKALDEARRA